jgi:hypothetical protein
MGQNTFIGADKLKHSYFNLKVRLVLLLCSNSIKKFCVIGYI